MVKLKKCLAKSKGLLSEEDENFLIKSEQDSQIGDDIQAANFAITKYYKKLHDQLNGLKQRVGLKAEPYPAFVLANEAVPKQEYTPKPPTAKQLKAAKKALRFKEAEKALSLVAKYNALSRAAKRFGAGPAIYQALRDEVGRINADIFLARRGIKILNKDGSIIKRPPTRSSDDFISLKKDRKQILKDARNVTAPTVEYAVIQDIANGVVFSLKNFKSFTKIGKSEYDYIPTYLLNDDDVKNVEIESYGAYNPDVANFILDKTEIANQAADVLENYFVKNARERATIDLVAMYEDMFLEKGEQGLDKEQLKELDLLELENEELIKAVENIEAEIAEMAQKDLDSEQARKREEQDQIEQDRMEDELAAGMRFSNSGLPEDEGGISTAPPLAGIQQAVETDVKKQIEDFGVAKDQVGPVYSVISKVFQGIKDAGLTAARTVGDWVGIGKGEEKSYSLKIDGKDTQVKNVQVDVVNGFYSPLEKVIAETKQDKMPAKQWADKFGKGEEAKWTGLADWLAGQPGSVSKADIQQYLKENRVNVVEVVKSDDIIVNWDDSVFLISGDIEIGEEVSRFNTLYIVKEKGKNKWSLFSDWDDLEAVEKYSGSLEDAKKAFAKKIQEEELEQDSITQSKFSQYQLEGEKENYKEILVTLPKKISKNRERFDELVAKGGIDNRTEAEQKEFMQLIKLLEEERLSEIKNTTDFKSSHFEEPNILVHLRMNTRKDSEGNKVLFLEEVQSDWGQQGKKEWFAKDKYTASDVKIDEYGWASIPDRQIESKIKKYTVDGKDEWRVEEFGEIKSKHKTVEEAKQSFVDKYNKLERESSKMTPTAPFVMDTNAWTKLGLKVALKEAVAQGADKIAWTTGEQQNARYDLKKQVDNINYKSNGDGTYLVYANKGNNVVFKEKALPEGQLEGSFGKDVAEKIINDKGQSKEGLATKVLEGDDLAVGGKGMKGFYGSPAEGTLGIVGNVAKSLFKQEPKITEIPTGEKYADYQWTTDVDGNDIIEYKGERYEFEKESDAEDFVSKIKKSNSTQYSIDITPELKASVASGQALFKKGESQKEFGGFETRDGKPIGFKYDTDQVARERFDFSKLTKIGSGSDRDVYDLGNGKVLKVAKTARGLNQNIYEGDYYLKGIVPEVSERGLNYVVAENTPRLKSADKITIYDPETNEEVGESTAGQMLKDIGKFTQRDFDNKKSELQDVLAKYGFQDILSYEVLWNDFIVGRNWGYKDGLAMHSDGGTFGGVQMLNEYRGKTNMSDPEFKKIYDESKKLKKQFGDTDKATMYKKDSEEVQAQYRIENGKNIIEAIKDFSGSPKAVVALTHEIMHPTVVTIIDGAKEGNKVGLKHTKTIVDEFNKATGENLTMDELIAGNDSFRDGKTTKQYRDVQEFIAESWEKYHTEGGKGFSSSFQQVLAQITEAFKAVYRSISGKEITPELRNFFDEILGKEQVSELNKQRQKESAAPGSFDKVYNAIKKALPKVNIILDDTIQGAGEVEGNTLRINPKYAGLDTPIHEAGHILIDAIGYKNKVVQAGIDQLRKTDLWKDVETRYPELSDEMLGKEVLAEAIGREGANIFESESQKNKFMTVLSYLFDKFKRMLGLEKNVAKSLAKQIIGGMGTKGLVGTTAEIQMAKKREKRILTEAENQVKELVEAIGENDDLSNVPYEELVDVYNAINAQNIPGKTKYLRDIKTRIGMNIFEREKIKLQNNKDFSAERAATKDIEPKDIKFKVLSHFTDNFPIFKSLSEMWDAAYFNKVKEAREGKNTNEKLAIDVIKDRNSRLGITDRAINFVQSLFTNINYKYFSFLDNGKGKLVTLSEAKKKGYSKAQIEYLKFVRDLIASRKTLMESDDIYNMDMEVLKLDKGFSESFKTDGLTQAFGNWITSSDGLRQTEIEFKNPLTGKTSITSYQNAETALVKYGEKGLKEKAESIALILKYNFAARRKKSDAENKKRGTYYLDENGQLKSKFDRSRPPEASYSTDFYKAVSEYIDDNAHITHISPLMPVIESIQYLNEKGVYEFDDEGNKKTIYAQKPNVEEWMKKWKDLHVLRQKDEGIPELDASLKFLRFLTSATTMMFNVPAGAMNIAIGNYNAWRTGNTEMVTKGNARLFLKGKKKFTSDYGYGIINPIAVDIARKYNAVSTDVDSNPIQNIGGIMSKLGHAITKYGEFQIQASGLLGLMSDTDFNSFEYRKNKFGVDELVFKKEVTKEKQIEIEARILKHINTVSDIQGKYGDKDRRNIQNNELGKALMQFKVYLPDYWRMRYGKDVGSWNIMVNGGLKQLKADIKKNGLKKGLWDNQSKEAKAFMSNLKGTAAVALFMILSHSDDDDDEGAVEFAEKMLSNLLGVFDPVQLKFTITRPIAAMGVVDRFLTAVEHLALWSDDAYMKSTSKYGEKGDAKILNDIKGLVPARKAADVIDMFSEDEE